MCVNDKLHILSMRNTLYILTIIDLKTSYVKVKLYFKKRLELIFKNTIYVKVKFQNKSINNNPYEDLKTFYVKVKRLYNLIFC